MSYRVDCDHEQTTFGELEECDYFKPEGSELTWRKESTGDATYYNRHLKKYTDRKLFPDDQVVTKVGYTFHPLCR